MRFSLLGSGSDGNGLLIEQGSTRVLIDCGFSVTETTRRMARLDMTPDMLSAILVTHEHADHVQGVERLARRFSIPVYSSKGTQHAMSSKWGKIKCHALQCTHPTQIGELEICPYTVPHDAREPLQYVVKSDQKKLGLLTDVGHTTAHIQESLNGCDALILEANHDLEKLANNPRYPSSLKARIRSIYGHLDNKTAANLLHQLDTKNLQHLIAAHLSVDNNHPDIVRSLFASASGHNPDSIYIADQEEGTPWMTIQ